MIDRREILATAASLGLRPNVVEKDYVLGWLLAGIYQHPALKELWIFKGGTCLKKCYFETYRFSEDLDFTLKDETQLTTEFLTASFRDVADWVYEQSGIELPREKLTFDVFQNRRGRSATEGRLSYRGPIAPSSSDLPRVKLDLTADEVLVSPSALRPVSHPYTDLPESGIQARCYSYEEIFAEKIRALAERARPRDLYDVINLYRHDLFERNPAAIREVLSQKCAFKGIAFPTMEGCLRSREELDGDWQAMLTHQLPSLPPVAAFWSALPELFSWISGAQRPAALRALPLDRDETIVRQPAGRLRVAGMMGSSALEIIRFAGANHLCVELDYVDDQGRRSTRVIEPYSLRSTSQGYVILKALRADNNEPRSYRIDRIQGARATDRTFAPQYTIELTPTGPISAPPIAPVGFGAPRQGRRSTKPIRKGPIYIYQCPVCQKRFRRTKRNSSLRPHKSEVGWPCASRRAILVDTHYG